MSLKVWLPLTGDLRNLGTGNLVTTVNGATVDNNGKIGKCYTFNGSTSYIALSGNDLFKIFTGGAQQFSITMWVFHADTTRAILFGDYATSGSINFNIELSTSHAVRFYWNGSPDTYPANATVAASSWTHIALTYDGTKLQSYINGVEKGSWSGTLVTKNKTSGEFRLGRDNRSDSTAFNGRMNDFRIYDHCLSLSEVREIAQGLILHYKFDDKPINISPNLVISITKGGQTTVDTTTTFGVQTSGSNADTYFTLNLSENITVGQRYLLSCYASGIPGNDYWTFPLGTQSNSALPFNIHNGFNNIEFVANDINWGSNRLFLDDTKRISSVCKFYNFILTKLENEVKDSSGYGHNGVITNAITQIDDSPRYSSSIHFSANNQYVRTIGLTTIGFSTTYTFAWWGKCSTYSGKMFWGFQDGIRLNGIYNGNLWNTGDGTSNPLYQLGTTTTVAAPSVNEWHHFVMVANGSTCQAYLDGELWGQAKTFKSISGTTLVFNGWDAGTNYKNTDASISDFRMYATPLLDSDIKKLYNTSMSVDRANNDFIYELDENDSNRELMQGIHLTDGYGTHDLSHLYSHFNENGEPIFISNGSAMGSDYIYIKPTGKTYYYDIELSCNTGNQFYIGFHRYDKDKTARSNNACAYIVSIKPTSDIVHKRYFGTVNLSTDGTNPCDSISLRVLNGWSGTTSGVTGTATIHRFSLREVASLDHQGTMKNGVLQADEFKEYEKASIYKNGIIEAGQFIER